MFPDFPYRPEHTRAVFTCVGPVHGAIQKTWEIIYREWLPTADCERIPDYDTENDLPGDLGAQDSVSKICIPVKRLK